VALISTCERSGIGPLFNANLSILSRLSITMSNPIPIIFAYRTLTYLFLPNRSARYVVLRNRIPEADGRPSLPS
jgi:hypothetical protein